MERISNLPKYSSPSCLVAVLIRNMACEGVPQKSIAKILGYSQSRTSELMTMMDLKEVGTIRYSRPRKSKNPTWQSWKGMCNRCKYPSDVAFRYYGGRGIRVCESWKDFSAFLEDMGERPIGTTLNRIDVDGDYTKDNCRWATASDQNRGRRSTIKINIGGKIMTVKEAAAVAGISTQTMRMRVKRGCPAESILLKKRYGKAE